MLACLLVWFGMTRFQPGTTTCTCSTEVRATSRPSLISPCLQVDAAACELGGGEPMEESKWVGSWLLWDVAISSLKCADVDGVNNDGASESIRWAESATCFLHCHLVGSVSTPLCRRCV